MHVRFTQTEGTYFLAAAAQYGRAAQEKQQGGDWAEGVVREQAVIAFYRRMRKTSTKVPNGYRFGPEKVDEAWLSEDLNLHDDERDGAFFVALALLDPRSGLKCTVGIAEEVVWPVLAKIRREKAARHELKLDQTKKERYDDDPEPKLAKVEDDVPGDEVDGYDVKAKKEPVKA